MDDTPHGPVLDWIASQADTMRGRVVEWANVNSGTRNLAGLARQWELVAEVVRSELDVEPQRVALGPDTVIDAHGEEQHVALGDALSAIKRPDAPLRVLCCIHMDTVYPQDHPFQTVTELGPDRLRGPGVTDAKGGLVVMLAALAALERSPWRERIGWEILVNPDEEIGSPGSAPLLAAAAKRNHLGLLFEPSLPDGSLVDRRKGSGNFTVVVRGRSAHAGRDFAKGRSALLAAADLALKFHALNAQLGGNVTINIGAIDGGGPVNVVPDLAILRLNVRTGQLNDEERVLFFLHHLVAECDLKEGISTALHGHFASPPKPLDERSAALLGHIVDCGRELGMTLVSKMSGGVSDGNKLAAAGLANIDTLGVRGDGIHSPEEYLVVPSLVERTQLAALLLMRLASGDIQWEAT